MNSRNVPACTHASPPRLFFHRFTVPSPGAALPLAVGTGAGLPLRANGSLVRRASAGSAGGLARCGGAGSGLAGLNGMDDRAAPPPPPRGASALAPGGGPTCGPRAKSANDGGRWPGGAVGASGNSLALPVAAAGMGRMFPHVGHRPRFPPASSGACRTPPQFEHVTLMGMTVSARMRGGSCCGQCTAGGVGNQSTPPPGRGGPGGMHRL
jgi:hypothetical protein